MKRRQRRPVLDLNGEQSESPRRRWQNKYQQIAVDHPEQNGATHNPLASLLGQYNSDSETEDAKEDSTKLNDKVNDFLKEIQLIVPEQPKANTAAKAHEPTIPVQQPPPHENQPPICLWQECFDESTGYPYYWHMETNEVTWEKPAEMRLFQESGNPTNVNPTHAAHSQVQWANFPPNTYPEMQTNIPEGMIPKEVVARNRNRQVGVQQSQQLQAAQETSKTTGAKDDESDDEKIEMITSFGNDETESDTSDNESPVKENPNEILVAKPPRFKKPSINQSASKKAEDTNVNVATSIGPSLPPGIVPMIHGPENASTDMRNLIDNIRNKNKNDNQKNSSENSESQCASSSLSSYEDPSSSSSPKGELKSQDVEEEDIMKRLKNQAKLLQSLGGEVPESVENLINDESADDIISQIEKETPLDHKDCTNSPGMEDSATEKCEIKAQSKFPLHKSDMLEKEIKISLVAGYGEDSDIEEEVSPKNTVVKPLFPISEYEEKGSLILQSSLPKICEKSDTSNESTVISANGTVKKVEVKQTESGSIRIFEYKTEETEKTGEEHEEIKESNQAEVNRPEISEPEETRVLRMEPDPPKPNKFLENLEMPTKAFQRKKRIAFDVVPNRSKSVEVENNQPNKPDAANLTFTTTSLDGTERRGFGFQKEPSEVDNHDLLDLPKEKSDKTNVQVKKGGINFVKGETANVKTEDTITKNEEKSENSKKQLKELTEIVMEKLKFLSEGSQMISAVQVMAIQLQTLIGAWEAGDLKENYLSDWLTGTGRELGRLERAAAPPGWDCQWDRSHKRYYYRSTTTGEAQWTYPESDVVGGTEEMDLCTTPPPPDHEEPPIIEQSQIETRQPKPEAATSVPSKEDIAETSVEGQVVEGTKREHKDPEAPPPPQISSPSPPPPPRIFAEDLKKGKKRRGSTSEKSSSVKKEKTEKETTATPDAKSSINPPLPPSPPKPSQPPLPPHPPLIPNSPNSEPLPPGVDAPEVSYPLAATTIEPGVIYTGASQTNPIYAATMATTVPLVQMEHHAAIMQGQLMHYPAYQHLQNQHAMIAAANSLTGQDAVQFMMTDYPQVYANSQVIAKPPVKSQRESLGSALDSFYSDIASMENTNTEQEAKEPEALSKEPIPSSMVPVLPEPEQVVPPADPVGKEKKKKKAKVGIGKKQKEMSSMVAKWQKAQQDFGDSD